MIEDTGEIAFDSKTSRYLFLFIKVDAVKRRDLAVGLRN